MYVHSSISGTDYQTEIKLCSKLFDEFMTLEPELHKYTGLEKARNIMLLLQIKKYKLIEESLVLDLGL